MDCGLHIAAPSSGVSTPLTGIVLAAALIYVRGWQRLRRGFPEIAAGCRPSAFFGGLLVLWIVIATPASTLDHRLLTFHMLQHLLLMTVAAPLLLVGSPTGALLCGLPQAIGRAALLMLWSGASRRIARALTHPILCWIAGTGVVIAWHLPAAHELGMRSAFWHVAQHVTFFAAALLFWWPILDRGPGSARLSPSSAPLYLFLATLPCDALSAFLTFSGRVLYPSHALAHGTFGLTALQDQECAGALMWFWVTIAYLLPAVAVTLRMLSPRASEAVSAGQTLVNPLKVGAEVTVRS